MFLSSIELLRFLEEREMTSLDLRFTDLQGTWRHLTLYAKALDEALLEKGVFLDGSLIPGWDDETLVDLLLKPKIETAAIDPFTAQPTLVVCCDVWDPCVQQPYAKDPRSLAVRAEAYLLSQTEIANQAFFSLEPEFFIFEDGEKNLSFKPEIGGGLSVPPVDQFHDMRDEMLVGLAQMGLNPTQHLHGVKPCQHQLGFRHDTLVKTADHLQFYKYVVKNVAFTYGKTVSFMPKCLDNDHGLNMQINQSLLKQDVSCFSEDVDVERAQTARHYIAGLVSHGKALSAFTNPTSNSYKRPASGIGPSYGLRSKNGWIEARFPDPSANGYLALSGMLMAGLDGIKRKLKLAPLDSADCPFPVSLKDALNTLDQDRTFLKEGGVFTDQLIDAYINLKKQEIG
ncbi:MAG: glutamine synthetase beta-grasp domain-containing protein [Alphaproteobacteria bacterium]